jgi:hypothetical protein
LREAATEIKQRWLDEADASCPEDESLPCSPARFERPIGRYVRGTDGRYHRQEAAR